MRTFLVAACVIALAQAAVSHTKDLLKRSPFFDVFANLQDDKTGIFQGEKYDSGYIKIKEAFGQAGEMFYWHFPARTSAEQAPLVIWLTGGPGCSSEMATLNENGPFFIQKDGTLVKNSQSWTESANVVWVDQPLGTGFSKAHFHYVFNEDQIAANMGLFLQGFLAAHPEYKNRPFYITGESYAGHYIPSIGAYLIKNPVSGLNFQGIALGNAWVDPSSQYVAYADYAHENGLINDKVYEASKKAFQVCAGQANTDVDAQHVAACNMLMQGLLGDRNPYDIRLKCEKRPLCYDMSNLDTFFNDAKVQSALGVSGKWAECSMLVHLFLSQDFGKSMTSRVEDVLKAGKRVLVYSGDKDFICNWRGGERWIANMDWEKKEDFARQEARDWVDQAGKKLGTYKRVDNLDFVRVFDAGHMVPMDQPSSGLELLKKFVLNELVKESPKEILA